MNIKSVFIFTFLFINALSTLAQSFIGIYGGFNSGKFSGDSPRNFKYASKLSYTAGIAYDFQLKEDVYLSLSTAYVNAKSTLEYPKEIDEVQVLEDSIFLDFHMISVPIIMKLISDNKRFQFSGGLEMILPFKLISDNTEEEEDLISNVNKVNLNMLFGIGYRIPIKNNFLVLNLTYSQGLSNLANNLDDPESLMPRVRYTSFRFTAVWLLPVGKNRFNPNLDNQ